MFCAEWPADCLDMSLFERIWLGALPGALQPAEVAGRLCGLGADAKPSWASWECTDVCAVDAYSWLKIEADPVPVRWLSCVEVLLAFDRVRRGLLTLLEGLSMKSSTLFGRFEDALSWREDVEPREVSKGCLLPGSLGTGS